MNINTNSYILLSKNHERFMVQIPFGNKDNSNTKDNTPVILTTGAIAVATAIAAAKGAKINLDKALNKKGVKMQDGIVRKIDTGELFNGIIRRNIKPFGIKKETLKYINGEIREKLYHDVFGREIQGYFYKNGKLVEEVRVDSSMFTRNKAFVSYSYGADGSLIMSSDGFCPKSESVFNNYRKKYN